MSIATEIQRLQNAKANIKTSIENKGVTVGDGPIDTYASKIDQISGGADISDYFETTGNGWFGSYRRHIKKIPPLDFTGVTSANDLFREFIALQEIPIISNTSSLSTLMSGFQECYSLEEINLSNWDVSNLTNCTNLFYNCGNLKKVNISNWNLAKCTGLTYWFVFDSNLEEVYVNNINTTNVSSFYSIFANCSKLAKIVGLFQGDSLINITTAFQNVTMLTEFNGFENLGKAYDTSQSANYSNYTLDLSKCTNLTHDSLVNIINNLYDINTKGCNAQQLKIGATNIAKLTSEEIAIATSKGWTVS